MTTQFHTRATLFYGMVVVLTACAGQARRDFAMAPARSLEVISESDIASSSGTTAYEVVERARPMYLITSLDLTAGAEREVYLNGVLLGGVGQLRLIPAREVREIRFVRAIDGGAYGVGRLGGAILVISKSGR